MLPLLMMRHRRIPRAKWRDCVTPNGKHWIEQNSLCGMAMAQGVQRKVVNIGLGIKQLAVEPRSVTVAAYVESLSHKLTTSEIASITSEPVDEKILRRLCIVLALKQAYIRAIGQPIGFDWSRLDFDIPGEKAQGDGHPLQGWEGQVQVLVEEDYQCACAFFRGTRESSFIWHKTTRDLDNWVQFINIDQMVKVIPKLTA
ncbi:hypothetical protein BD779DRAFT_1541712 [Infundibulicybe gibba]|nr:hypothetical protein BD779DRAFT_1541712 [Infundibulicybe gibba]